MVWLTMLRLSLCLQGPCEEAWEMPCSNTSEICRANLDTDGDSDVDLRDFADWSNELIQ